jgi:IS30 family transposase
MSGKTNAEKAVYGSISDSPPRSIRSGPGGRDRRGQIPNRVSIDQRSHTIELRRRFGDWEGDTIVGKGHRGALITLVERKSNYLLMKQVDRYTAQEVHKGIEAMIRQDDLPFKSLTVDNGREFACHE